MNENRRILGATLSTSLVHHFVEIHLSHSCMFPRGASVYARWKKQYERRERKKERNAILSRLRK